MALQAVGLKTSIWNNNLKSVILLAFYPVILGAIVWAIAFVIGANPTFRGYRTDWMMKEHLIAGRGPIYDDSEFYKPPIESGINFASEIIAAYWPTILAIAAVWFLIALFFHTRMVRALAHSRPVDRAEEPGLYNLLENLCISRGLPMPRLEIIESQAMNAFASGIDRRSYTITVTRGLLNNLQRDEIEAVLGHELTHIMNNDVRLLIISIVFVGMIGFAAQMLWSSMRYSLWTRRRSDRGGPTGFILMFVILAILWLGYLATLLTRFALSRRREYMADAGSVELTKNPEAMMRALLRIARNDRIEFTTADIALMCIENSRRFLGLFATHPPVEKRVAAISAATGAPVPGLDTGPEPGKRRNPWR